MTTFVCDDLDTHTQRQPSGEIPRILSLPHDGGETESKPCTTRRSPPATLESNSTSSGANAVFWQIRFEASSGCADIRCHCTRGHARPGCTIKRSRQ